MAGRVALCAAALPLLVAPVVMLSHPVSYFPLIAAVLLVVVSAAYLQVVRRSVSVEVDGIPPACERGQASALSIRVENGSVLPVARLQMELFVTDLFGEMRDVRQVSCSVAPRGSAQIGFEASFPHLGTYRAGVARASVVDLLGLLNARVSDGIQRSVAVRPRKVDLGGEARIQALPDESRSSLKPVPADDVDYAAVREYRYGDPLKTVHWKLTGRSPDGLMYTRMFEAYVNPALSVIIDPLSPYDDPDELMALFDGMVEGAMALASRARESGMDADIRYLRENGEPACLRAVGWAESDELVASMMKIMPPGARSRGAGVAELVRAAGLRSGGSGNVALVTSDPESDSLAALCEVHMHRRNTLALVAVPRSLEGKERERRLAPLQAISAAGVAHCLVESTEVSTEVIGL